MRESKKAIHEDLPSLALRRSREPDPLRSSVPLELMQKMFHPKNIMKFNDWGFDTDVHPLPLRTSREPDPLRSSVPLEMYEE